MRVLVLLALLCACGARQQPRLLFERVPAAKLGTIQEIRVDLLAIDTDRFSIGLGPQTLIPRQIARSPLPNGSLVQATFAGGGTLVLARVGATMTGVIRLGGTGFEIQPFRGGHRLIPRSWKDARTLHGPNWDDVASHRGPRPTPRPVSNEPVIISVQFAYTARVLERRGLDGIKGHIAIAMKQLESACKATGVNLEFRATEEPAHTIGTEGDPPNKRTIYDLWRTLSQHTDFLDAHAAREAAHADILVLLVDEPEGGLGIATIMATAATAVAVVDHNDSLFTLTIPHEIGHIMGGIHEDDTSDNPYEWGHGYVGDGGRTIMSNPCNDEAMCVLLEQWSSPALHGDATHDVARVLRETGPVVAKFGENL